MTRVLELFNLVNPDSLLPTQFLNDPVVAKRCAERMSVNDQIEYICAAGKVGQGALRQLHDNKLYWDKEGNLHIRE